MPESTAFCNKIDTSPWPTHYGRMTICLLRVGHRGRCTWNVCGDTGGTGADGDILCGRPRGHKGLHSMTW